MDKNFNLAEKIFLNIQGSVKIIKRNLVTGKEKISFYKNIYTRAGKLSFLKKLANQGSANQPVITYCAFGTDDTLPSENDEKLGNEIFRKVPTEIILDEENLKITYRIFLDADEANDYLKEIGLFGDNATSTKDSGTLFTRALIDEDKTSSETMTIEYTLSF